MKSAVTKAEITKQSCVSGAIQFSKQDEFLLPKMICRLESGIDKRAAGSVQFRWQKASAPN
jgi:hypothetical protein